MELQYSVGQRRSLMIFSECQCPCLHGLVVARSDSVIGPLSRVLPSSPAKLHGVASAAGLLVDVH
jgi:hypothetical protein